MGTQLTRMGLALVAFIFALFLVACSDEACEEAESKLRNCIEALNCNEQDPVDRSKCAAAKKAGEDALTKMSGAPCVGQVSDLADQINRCDFNSTEFCDCF